MPRGTFVVGDQVLVLAMLAGGHHHAVVVRHFRHHLGVPTAADLARVHHQKLLQLQMLRPPRRRDDLGLWDLAPKAFRGASGGVVGHGERGGPPERPRDAQRGKARRGVDEEGQQQRRQCGACCHCC